MGVENTNQSFDFLGLADACLYGIVVPVGSILVLEAISAEPIIWVATITVITASIKTISKISTGVFLLGSLTGCISGFYFVTWFTEWIISPLPVILIGSVSIILAVIFQYVIFSVVN